jgi:hypothetical protein
MKLKRILSIVLICIAISTLFAGCTKGDRLLVAIEEYEYYMGTQLSEMLEHLTIDRSCDFSSLNAGERNIVKVNDGCGSSYSVGLHNDSRNTLSLEDCKINYVHVKSFDLKKASLVEFDGYTMNSPLQKLISELGDYNECFEKTAAKCYWWDDGEFAVYIRIGKEHARIEEIACGESSALIEFLDIGS